MDDASPQQEPDIQQPNGFLTSLPVFGDFLNWLFELIRLTEEEQKDAGIYLGD